MSVLYKKLYDAVSKNNVAEVSELLGRGASVNYQHDYFGYTPLCKAARQGNVEIADLLIRNKADVNAPDNYNQTPLHLATQKDVAQILIQNGADVNSIDFNGLTPLHKAAAHGQVEVIDILIRNNAEVNATDNDGKTPLDLLEDMCKTTYWYITNDEGNSPLHQAARRGHNNMVNALVGLGANVSAVNIEGYTPLHEAALQGNVEIAVLLIRNKADVNAPSNYGYTPLHEAALQRNVKIADLLIRNKANVNAPDNYSNTPLHKAVNYKNKGNMLVMVESLIRLGANVSVRNNQGDTPLHEGINSKYNKGNMVTMVESLIRLGANLSVSKNNVYSTHEGINDSGKACKMEPQFMTKSNYSIPKGVTPLHEAAKKGYVEIAELLINNKADVNAPDNVGNTPLHEGINSYYNQGKMVMMVESLICLGANVSVSNNKGVTPLHKAATVGNVEIAELLIRNKADVNAPDNVGVTPLHEAAAKGNVKIAEMLIRNKADVYAPGNDGVTPFHKAAAKGYVEIAELLIRNKADVNAPDNVGVTPLHMAAAAGQVKIIDVLIRNNAEVNVSDNSGMTPLDLLEDECKTTDWYITNDEGNSPLHQTASSGRENMVKALVGLGANVSAVNIEGDTPLHKALDLNQMHYYGKDMVMRVESLVRLGANVSVSNNKGKTPLDLLEDKCKTDYWYITNDEGNSPLHQAASSGRENLVKALIILGANVSAVNIEGDTPLHKSLDLKQMHYCGKDMVMRVESLVRLGANVSISNNKGKTPLDLLEDKCKTDYWYITNDEGNSPLHQAASSGREHLIKALIVLGANVSAVNIEGATPLHKAAMQGSVEVTDILIRNNATVNVTDNNGRTPLHDAALQGNIKLTDILIRNNADVNSTDNMGRTPLHDAAMKGNTKLTDILIRNNAEVNASDNMGKTPLVLLEENCQIVHKYKKDDKGDSSLHQAANKGEDNVDKDFVSLGDDVSAVDNKGDSRLHQAASKGQDNVVKYLVNLGDDVSAVNNEGNSPLHMAVIYKKENIVTTLITLGADPSARNNEGKTPIDIAEDMYTQKKNSIHEYKYRMILKVLKGNSHNLIRTRQHSRVIAKTKAPTKDTMASPTTMQSKKSKEMDIQLPWLVDAKEFQRMLSQGTFLSYENRLSLGGPCRAGKSTLASVLIDEKIPLRWNSTDGLVIYFGRNGIDIGQKKMVPLKKGDRGHDVLAKILRGKPDVLNISTPTELDQTKTPVSRNTSKNQNENNISKALIKELQMHHSVTRTSTNELENQTNTSITNSDLQIEGTEAAGKHMSAVKNFTQTLDCQKLQLQSDILDEVRTGQYKIDIAPSDLIDFGGQKSYDMTHQLFIQHKGSFLLMFDGRYGLHNQLNDYPEGVNASSIIKHWVDSILTYTADTAEIMPMILFAATHRDLCGGDTAKMKECFLAEIKEMFSSHEKKNHIHLDTLYFINGVDKNDDEIKRMTDQIVIFAMEQTSWGQRRPMQWVPLELQISNMKLKNINILTKENIQEINVLNADLALNENQIDDFLLVQHSLGKLLYYNLPGLDKFIIIHPPALVNILRSFVTDEQFWPADTNLRNILETMANTGRICKRDILKIWEQPQFNQYMQEDAIKEFVLKLLVHLDILIVPKAFKQSSTDVYLVPCMIKAMRPDFNNLGSQREKTICLQYILAHSSIPSALAYKVIGAAVIAWPLKEAKTKPCLYHKAAVLNVSEDDELRIWVDDNRVNVYLTNKKSLLSISPDIAASIQECLTKNIESSLLFYHSSFGRTLNPTRVSELYYMEIGIPCGGGDCFISSLEVAKTNKWTCKNEKEHNTNYIRYWIFDKSQEICSVGCAGLTDIELQTQPSDKHLVRLGSQIEYGIFKDFFLNLGMKLHKWHSIESTYVSHSTEGIRSMALRQWKTSNLSKLKDPTLKHISDALKEVNLDSHLVCQIFRENMDLVEYAELNLQADPTDQHLKELSNQIGNCPIQLGIELGLSFTEVEHSLFRFPKDLPGLVEDILAKWKAKSKVKTILSLMMALQRVDAGGVRYLRDIAKQ